MKHSLPILFLFVMLVGCTRFEVEEQLPDITSITPEEMTSELDRIHIQADSAAWKYMYEGYNWDVEIPAFISYFGAEGQLLFTRDATIEIKGAGSAQFDMKSIGIVFEESVDNQDLQLIPTAQALPNDHLSTLTSVRLRNSGNDFGNTQLKDLALTELAIRNSIDIELKYGKPVHAFVNGRYFGLLNLRTENDLVALGDLLTVSQESITIMKMDFPNKDLDFREGDEALAQQVIDAIEQEDANALEGLIDIDNFIDYILFEDYVGNIDWPHNNAKMYSVDGSKFRFLLYDLDWAAMRNKTQRLPKMEYLDDDISKIYQILRSHDDGFIAALETRQAELYAMLSTSQFNEIVDEMAGRIAPEIGYLIQRWGPPHSKFEWQMHIDRLKQDFEVNEFYNRKLYGFL